MSLQNEIVKVDHNSDFYPTEIGEVSWVNLSLKLIFSFKSIKCLVRGHSELAVVLFACTMESSGGEILRNDDI